MPPCLETARINKQRELIQQQSPESPTATLTWHASKYKVQFEQHAQGSKEGKNAELYISPFWMLSLTTLNLQPGVGFEF